MANGFRCESCGRTDVAHHARGMCNTCYKRGRRADAEPSDSGQSTVFVNKDGDTTAVSTKSPDAITPDELLGTHGIDASQMVETSYKANIWTQADGSTAHQLTVHAKPKLKLTDYIEIPEPWNGKSLKPKGRPHKGPGPRYIPLFPDPHCPLQERALCAAAENWLETFKPDTWICLGDEQDASAFSRHRSNPAFDFDANTGLEETYRQLERWAIAADGVEWLLLPGNHSYWLKLRLLEKLPALAGLKQPGSGVEFLSLDNLLNLKSLNGKAVEAPGEYFDATLQVLEDLTAMHGTKTGKHGGAATEIEGWEGTSIIQGHDHKLTVVAITRRLPDGTEVQRWAVSAGTMAKRELGYDPRRNVNQGFIVIVVWEDGRWKPEIVDYDPQTQSTTWRDWRYDYQEAA